MEIRTLIIVLLLILLIGSLSLAGYLWTKENRMADVLLYPDSSVLSGEEGSDTPAAGMSYIQLFFLTSDQSQLQMEKRPVAHTGTIKERVQSSMKELLNGPRSPDLIDAIPPGVVLQHVFWSQDERCLYVSFSEQLVQNNPGHALSEWASIYSIVNTAAAQSPSIQKVQILQNGQPIEDPWLIWDWSQPFEPDMTFVRRGANQDKAS